MRLNRLLSFLTILLLLNSCDYRTPSKERFEKITKISLPNPITVIQDRFEESGPDYGLFYKVTLNQNDCISILNLIQVSNDWKKNDHKWEFYKTENGIIYNIVFSKNECQISYNEELI
jgi:hypothetical protein